MYHNKFFTNQFQILMCSKFEVDLFSPLAVMANVKGREDLVYKYINSLSTYIRSQYGLENPSGLVSEYELFKNGFVKYWRQALDISRSEVKELENIFDEELIPLEKCRTLNTACVSFENGKALSADDCLNAVYEVMKMV